MAEKMELRFVGRTFEVREPTVVVDNDGKLWRIDPKTGTARQVKTQHERP